jgi:hypothetical protein
MAVQMRQTCGNCKWFEKSEGLTVVNLYGNGDGGACAWPAPAVVLAKSMTTYFGYASAGTYRRLMLEEEVGCPTWEEMG